MLYSEAKLKLWWFKILLRLLEENFRGPGILAIHRPFSSSYSYMARLHFDQAVVAHGRLIRSAEKGTRSLLLLVG